MRFIKISEDVLVNPEFISAVEYSYVEGMKALIVRVDGKDYIATVAKESIITELITSGTMEPQGINSQFWAG